MGGRRGGSGREKGREDSEGTASAAITVLSLPSPSDVEEASGQLGEWKERVTLLEKDLKFQEVKKNEAINKLAQVRGGREGVGVDSGGREGNPESRQPLHLSSDHVLACPGTRRLRPALVWLSQTGEGDQETAWRATTRDTEVPEHGQKIPEGTGGCFHGELCAHVSVSSDNTNRYPERFLVSWLGGSIGRALLMVTA